MKIGVEKFGITKHGGFVTKEHNLRVVYAETQLVCDVCTCYMYLVAETQLLLSARLPSAHTVCYVFLEQEHI